VLRKQSLHPVQQLDETQVKRKEKVLIHTVDLERKKETDEQKALKF
jgi:hypothetical protein